ncbi:hypothetical protein [Falsibacillus albus]|uniref:Uncharacterized protein n=1 Tax=Falsibacillus albus TaxID=2478915 RepID=A0A3L7JU04_9BACI|nr:hypothetical protein [Falsibacillus albus]RLQ94000.1 hypothetical protein D9X91_15295 [Falsibacillus albus]
MILSNDFFERLKGIVSYSWEIFSQKVGSGLIQINKEASMQLKYAYILQQFIPLIIFDNREKVEIELESTCFINGKTREIDILLKGTNCVSETYTIAIELKCYKKLASSGNPRGAHDIFMKDVYCDLFLLEQYCNHNHADLGISLVMTNYQTSVNPLNKSAKCWAYDISNGAQVSSGTNFCTPIGGNEIDFTLNKNYSFLWKSYGEYWFTEIIGS